MAEKKTYILTQNYAAPYVTATGSPQNPQAIRAKRFLKGEVVVGELKHANSKPAFLLVAGVLVIPVQYLKEVTTKDIMTGEPASNASGESKTKEKAVNTIKKFKYSDAILLGAALGVGGAFLAEKQGWLAVPDKKNKIVGAVIGSILFGYGLYRYRAYLTDKQKQNKE